MKQAPPRKVIVLTLNMATQNKVLTVLSTMFGITETFERPQQLIMSPLAYGVFVAACSQLDDPPTLKQITGEFTQLIKVPDQKFLAHLSGWDFDIRTKGSSRANSANS
jgi:hypothetical protein